MGEASRAAHEEVRRAPARSRRSTAGESDDQRLAGGVQAFLAGRPSTNCHSDCPVARLRWCPFSHRAWSIGGPAPGVSIRAGPPPVTRGVPPGNVATCAPHFGQDGSLILASLALARGLQVALPDWGSVPCGTGYETRHASTSRRAGLQRAFALEARPPDDDELLANRHAASLSDPGPVS